MSDTLTSTINWLTGVADTVTGIQTKRFGYPVSKNEDPTITYPALFMYLRRPESNVGSHDINIGRMYETHNFTFEVLYDPHSFPAETTTLSGKFDTAQAYMAEFLFKLTSVEYKNRFQLNHGERDIPITKDKSVGNDNCYSIKCDVPIRAFAGTSTYTADTTCVRASVTDIQGTLITTVASGGSYAASIITPAFTQSSVNINAGESITFTDQTTATHDEYHWDFGDGTESSSQNPSKTYYVAGTYSVTLMVGNKSNGASGILKKTNLITVNNVLLLDQYSGADAAYSFRKLRAAYSGSANRVYNGTTQADIGFSSNEYDTAAYSAFAPSQGFAAKWYDQSGNARDLIQAATTAMPEIKLAHQNSKPGHQFDGSTDYIDASGVTTPNGKTIYLVVRDDDSTASGEKIYFDSVTTTQHGFYKTLPASSPSHAISAAFGTVFTTTTAAAPQVKLFVIIQNGASSSIYRNGTLIAQGNFGSNALNGLRLGALRGASATLFFNGDYFEFLCYPAVHNTATREAIQTIINSYWGIY